jgi:uncharacterized membrane protein
MDQPRPADPAPRRPSRIGATLKALLKTRITAGLIIVLPIWITWLLVRFVFGVMRDSSQWVVYGILHGRWMEWLPQTWTADWKVWTDADLASPAVQWGIGIFSVFLTIFILYTIGLLTANIVGRRILDLIEAVVDRVPLVKTVYRASKQILVTFTGNHSQTFQRVALIPFMSNDVRSIGFITNTFKDARTGEDLCTIFYATTPNPTTGFVLIVKRSDLVELDWSIEEAVKAIMSGGILLPPGLYIPAPSPSPLSSAAPRR